MALLAQGKALAEQGTVLDRLSLIRDIYRALIANNRTYAAFEPEVVSPLIEQLSSHKVILDPMAGYGGLLSLCARSKHKVSAFCVEYNPPAYLWQILINPDNAKKLMDLIEVVLALKARWPSIRFRAAMCNDWYPIQSVELLLQLWLLFQKATKKAALSEADSIRFALALMLPFVGRFACSVQGNVVTHIKQGGMCVYNQWEKDFSAYLKVVNRKLNDNFINTKNFRHTSLLDDCKSVDLSGHLFSAMITSPPYPNSRDYYSIFAPENAFLELLEQKKLIRGYTIKNRLIGSPIISVSGEEKKSSLLDVKSKSARKFLKWIEDYKGTQQLMYDNKIYYLPYFAKYFSDLEGAYNHIAQYICAGFEGFVIVVNNTHRKKIVPVREAVIDIWRDLGFVAEVIDEYTRELSHVGGINPNVKGLSARHMEYTIKVSKP